MNIINIETKLKLKLKLKSGMIAGETPRGAETQGRGHRQPGKTAKSRLRGTPVHLELSLSLAGLLGGAVQDRTGVSRSSETPTPLGPSEDPTHMPNVGSYGFSSSYERGTPALGISTLQKYEVVPRRDRI